MCESLADYYIKCSQIDNVLSTVFSDVGFDLDFTGTYRCRT